MTLHFLGITGYRKKPLGWEAGTGKRITIRLDDQAYTRLQEKCTEINGDISLIVRQALQEYLQVGGKQPDQSVTPKILIAPEEIGVRIPRYLSWTGDLRAEVRRLFIEVLAAAHACLRSHPKTSGLRQIHDGMLSLGRYMEFGGNGRQN